MIVDEHRHAVLTGRTIVAHSIGQVGRTSVRAITPVGHERAGVAERLIDVVGRTSTVSRPGGRESRLHPAGTCRRDVIILVTITPSPPFIVSRPPPPKSVSSPASAGEPVVAVIADQAVEPGAAFENVVAVSAGK